MTSGSDAPAMKCERCGKSKAAFKITRIEDGVPTEVNLCPDCTAEASPFHQSLKAKEVGIDQLLELLSGGAKIELDDSEGAQKVDTGSICPSCGIDIALYRTTGMLGCPDCYEAFVDELEQDMQRLHGATRHVGSEDHPAMRSAELQKRLSAMREELVSAVEFEDFERAAFLRDAISQAEKELAEGSRPAKAPTATAPEEQS